MDTYFISSFSYLVLSGDDVEDCIQILYLVAIDNAKAKKGRFGS